MRAKRNSTIRPLRGGCYDRLMGNLRVASRFNDLSVFRKWNYGFRFVVRRQE